MTAESVPDKVKVARDPAPTTAQRASLQAELEERLAAARVERAKVLAAKGKSNKKPKARPPRFLGDDVGPDLAQKAPCKAGKLRPPPVDPPPQLHAGAAAQVRVLPVLQQPARSKRLLSPTAIIAFASFFGLGFGMILSFGAVVGLGWVSLSDIRGKLGAAEPVAAAAPSILDNPDLDFSSAELVSARAAALAAMPQQKPPTPQAAPALGIARVPDKTLTGVLSPSPLVTGGSDVITLAAPAGSASVALAFSSEAPVPKTTKAAARPAQPGRPNDLPVLTEPNSLRVLTAMAAMASPAPGALPSASRLADREGPKIAPVQVLFDPAPEAHPKIAAASPVRPSVGAAVIGRLGAFQITDFTTEIYVPGINATLIAPPPLASLPAPVAAHALPVTGGPLVRAPSLAAKLGYVGQDADQIALITYAPASVTATALDEKLGDLETTGFPIAAPNRVNFKVSKTHVRYYTRADETVARAIAAEVGGAARDFTREKIASPSGRIEIWMAGSRVGATTPKRATVSTAQRRAALKAQQQAVAKAQLKSRLVDRLKQREYLR